MQKPNYGIDAPKIVVNLFFSASGLILLASYMQSGFWFWGLLFSSLPFFLTGSWMLYGIKVTKPRLVEKMIQDLTLQGNEKALDLGCGRGILLCQIAKYLPNGEAHGIDLWIGKDQSCNHLDETLKNAHLEGVQDKITLHTGNVCSLTFANDTFDVVASSLCLHNIEDQSLREKALTEMLRVLKPGGKFTLLDIQRVEEYRTFLTPHVEQMSCSPPIYAYCPPVTILSGTKK